MAECWVIAVKYPHAPLGFAGTAGLCAPLAHAQKYPSEAAAAEGAAMRFGSRDFALPVFKLVTYEDAVILATAQEIQHG